MQHQYSSLYGTFGSVAEDTAVDKSKPDPAQWLKENSDDRFSIGGVKRKRGFAEALGGGVLLNRPRAALISLVRNSELEGILQR